ncbi:MAG: hypothetical protein ACTSU4_15255 [Promethearchaeota archaeon]
MRVQIRCPSCSKQGKIDVSEESLKNVSRGLLAVNIAKGIVCEHSFVAYIDKNMQVRDYFIADFQIELPSIEPIAEEVKRKIPPKDQLDVDLIKMNMTPSFLLPLIRMIFMKKNLVIVLEDLFIKKHLQAFHEFITEDNFEFNFTYVSENDYRQKKDEFKGRYILKGKDVFNDKGELIDTNKWSMERRMVQKFYEETDPDTCLIILKNEIKKIHELTKSLIDFIDNTKNKDTLNSKKMIDYLNATFKEKISVSFLEFLLDIIENYFEKEIPKKSRVSNFLGFL